MSGPPGGATRVACILGWPASHSLSPAIHNAAFAATGLDWIYVAFPVAPDDIAAAVAGIRALGIAGANVTMPHKRAVMPLMDELTAEADRIGAVNTIISDGGRLIGHNTDGAGFLASLSRDAGFDPAGKRAVLLGAGGAARAVAVALTGAGAQVRVTARKNEAAAEIAHLAGCEIAAWDDRVAAAHEAELVVNATPVGVTGGDSPLDASGIAPGATVVDLIYAPPRTPLLRDARVRGARDINGIGMLVHQAALAFERWTGVPAPVQAMRSAAESGSAMNQTL